MTYDEFDEWIERVGRVLRGLAIFAVFIGLCMFAGYAFTKLEQSQMKKTVPDCGSCKIYKEGVKK